MFDIEGVKVLFVKGVVLVLLVWIEIFGWNGIFIVIIGD